MHTFQVLQVNLQGSTPASIVIAGDYTAAFQGKFYRDSAGAVLPWYSTSVPSTYSAIPATSFVLANNTDYSGTYTVYTPASAADTQSSVFDGTNTTIYVNETLGTTTDPSSLSSGTISNVSTYIIDVAAEPFITVPPTTIISTRPINLFGRTSTPWGEDLVQSLVKLSQNFASSSAPANPFVGQTWFDTAANSLKLRTSSGWAPLAIASKYRAQITTAAQTWTITHNLNLPAPYIALTQIFVNTSNGVKMIIPSDISFVDANTLTVTFTAGTSYTGYVLIQA